VIKHKKQLGFKMATIQHAPARRIQGIESQQQSINQSVVLCLNIMFTYLYYCNFLLISSEVKKTALFMAEPILR